MKINGLSRHRLPSWSLRPFCGDLCQNRYLEGSSVKTRASGKRLGLIWRKPQFANEDLNLRSFLWGTVESRVELRGINQSEADQLSELQLSQLALLCADERPHNDIKNGVKQASRAQKPRQKRGRSWLLFHEHMSLSCPVQAIDTRIIHRVRWTFTHRWYQW